MMSALGSIVGWVGAHAKEVVVLAAVSTVVAWASVEMDRWLRDGAAKAGPSITYQSGLITGYDDLKADTPTRITVGDVPDSTDTRTECIAVPTWVESRTGLRSRSPADTNTTDEPSSRTSSKPATATRPARSERSGEPLSQMRARLQTLPYVAVPMESGRPSLAVTSEDVTLSAWSPRTGQPLEFAYDVPRDTWRVGLDLNATALTDAVSASAALTARRRTTLGWVGVGPAYGALVTDAGARTGLGVTVSFESTLWGR